MKRITRRKLTERAMIILQASVGEITITEACRQLNISRQRFYELEERAMEAFLNEIEPKPPGRPRKKTDPTLPLVKQIESMEKENTRLRLYIKMLKHLAGIEDRGKKRGRKAKELPDPGEENVR